MRNGKLVFLGALALSAMATAAACSNGPGPSAAGGATNTAGSSSGGTNSSGGASTPGGASSGGTCSSVSACGGSVLGAWTVSSSCLALSGPMDVAILSLGCTSVPVTGSLTASGSFVANADGTSADNTRITGSATFPLSSACLSVSSVPRQCSTLSDIFKVLGWTTSVCTDTNGQCNCSVSVDRAGGVGFVADQLPVQGNFTTSANTLTNNDLKYAYCAAGDTLTLTPQMSSLSGTVTLSKGGTGGAGGAPSTGGTGGAAAMAGSGSGGAPGAGGSGGAAGGGSAGAAGSAGGTAVGNLPCDIYAAGNTVCVGAHSTIRALLAAYNGPLYEVKRASDGTTKDIPVLAPGGYANSATQDTFCTGTTCTITKLYDQSGHGNFLEAETPDSGVKGHTGMTASNAAQEMLSAGGHKVYSLYMKGSQAYWRDGSKTGMPIGAAPQGIYMVTSGKHVNGGCCFDYGNGETNRTYQPGPSMDAIYFGNGTTWGTGNGAGPWVMADLEDGVFSGASTGKNNNLLSNASTYVTAMEKNNGTTEMQLKASDATAGTLATYYKGALPPGKNPMKKQGALVLGSGGDCCLNNNNASLGTFYEGAIVAGYPSDATDASVQANIVSAGYGK